MLGKLGTLASLHGTFASIVNDGVKSCDIKLSVSTFYNMQRNSHLEATQSGCFFYRQSGTGFVRHRDTWAVLMVTAYIFKEYVVGERILLCGRHISHDTILQRLLGKKFSVMHFPDHPSLAQVVEDHSIALLIFEPSAEWERELAELLKIKKRTPEIRIIIVNGGESREAVIRSFKCGFEDYFKKPYDALLLAERAEALVRIFKDCSKRSITSKNRCK